MSEKLKLLLARWTAGSPSSPSQPEISKKTVAEAQSRRPKRICFSSTHQGALKANPGANWVGSFSVPFRQSVYPIFSEMTSLSLSISKNTLEGHTDPGWWRSVRDDDEYKSIADWVAKLGGVVFLRDQLALSIALGEYQNPQGGRSEVGELESNAKWGQDKEAITALVKMCSSTIHQLPYYKDADAICAVPPRPDKEFDLPSAIAARVAKKLEILDITSQLSWKKVKPSLRETPFAEKWDALASVGLAVTQPIYKSVVLIDDLYQSGITMQYVASRLLDAGVKRVLGLTLVKARRDSDNQ